MTLCAATAMAGRDLTIPALRVSKFLAIHPLDDHAVTAWSSQSFPDAHLFCRCYEPLPLSCMRPTVPRVMISD